MADHFCDSCDPNGYYHPVWGHPLSDYSHCKDPFDGTEIPNTGKKVLRTKEFWDKRKKECKKEQEKIIEKCRKCLIPLDPQDLIGSKWNNVECDNMRIV